MCHGLEAHLADCKTAVRERETDRERERGGGERGRVEERERTTLRDSICWSTMAGKEVWRPYSI